MATVTVGIIGAGGVARSIHLPGLACASMCTSRLRAHRFQEKPSASGSLVRTSRIRNSWHDEILRRW